MKKLIIAFMFAMIVSAGSNAQPCTVTIISTPLPSGCDSLYAQFTFFSNCLPYSFIWTNGSIVQSIICCSSGVYYVTVSDNGTAGCCTTITDSIMCNSTVSVETNSDDDHSLQYYADESRNIFTINNAKENLTAHVYDVLGKRINTFHLNAKQKSFDYSSFANGLYVAVIYRNNKVWKAIRLLKK